MKSGNIRKTTRALVGRLNLLGIFILVLAAVACSLTRIPAVAKDMQILSISEIPESKSINYYNTDGAFMFFANYYLSPKTLLSDDFEVTQRGWQRNPEPFAGLEKAGGVILWECPRAVTDERDDDLYHQDLEVVTDEVMAALEAKVRGGGGLVIAGGALCYGEGADKLGSTDDRKGEFRFYHGFDGTALEALLPVDIPAGITLTALPNAAGNMQAAKPSPMLEGLDLQNWVIGAYHKVSARPEAEVLATTASGDPLIVRWPLGKGRVVCVLAAPHAAGLVRNPYEAKSPAWDDEAIFWDRCVRWACGMDYYPSVEENLADRVEKLTADLDRSPLELAQSEYPYGADVRHSSTPDEIRSLVLKYFAELGMNHIVTAGVMTLGDDDGTGSSYPRDYADRWMRDYQEDLERHGLYMFLKPEPHQGPKVKDIPAEKWAQIVQPSGAYATNYGAPRPCTYSPSVLEEAAKQMDGFAGIAKQYNNITGAYCDDEWTWVLGYRSAYEGDVGIGCYSPWVNDIFKERTGMEAPMPVYHEPGYVVQEDDPWLRWCEEIRQDPAAMYNKAIGEAAHKHDPDFQVSNYPGGFDGESDIMLEEIYLDCWRESELETFERVDVRANFREDHDRTGTPIHALMGIFRMPESKSIYPETLRLTAGACLGAAARGIILWNGENIWSPWMQHEGRDDLGDEAARLGAYLQKYGPMFLEMTKPESDVWMLSHWFWINSFDNYYHCYPEEITNKEQTWRMFQVSDLAVPSILRAGMPAEFVTEKQLMSDRLFERKVVLVPSLQYCRQAVVDNLEEFIRRGGKVFIDTATAVEIEGAEVLPFDFSQWHQHVAAGKRPTIEPCELNYRKQRGDREALIDQAIPILREHVTPHSGAKVKIDHPEAAHRMLVNGETTYLFVYNSDVDTGYNFNVSYHDLPGVIYDIAAGEEVEAKEEEEGVKQFQVGLQPGGWKVFALTPEPVKNILASPFAVEASRVRGEVRVLNKAGATFSGAVPLEIVINPGSDAQSVFRATSAGVANLDFPLPDPDMQVRAFQVRELMTGKTVSVAVQ